MPNRSLPRTYKQLIAQKDSAPNCEPMYSADRKNGLWHFWKGNEPGIVLKISNRKKELEDEYKYNILAKAMGLHVADVALYDAGEKTALALEFIPGVTSKKFDLSYALSPDVTYNMSRKFKLTHVGTAILGLIDAHEENIMFRPNRNKQQEFYVPEDFADAEPYLIDTALGFGSEKNDYGDIEYEMLEHAALRQNVGLLFDYQQGILDTDTIEDAQLKKSLDDSMAQQHHGLLQADIPHDDYIQCALDHKAALQENRALLEKEDLGAYGEALQRRCDEMVDHLQSLKKQNKPI